MKITFTLANALASLILISAPHGAQSHSVAARHCITSANKLRIFLEHWHDASGVGSGTFKFNVNTVPADMTAIGAVRGVSDTTKLPGCTTECTTLASECTGLTGPPGQLGGSAGTHHDWVWFDFAITDTVELLQGNNYYLVEGCNSLYPVTITAANSDCGCACTELGQQCCIPHSPSQYEECVYAADLSLTPIVRPTAGGTKCCVHPSDPDRIILQHTSFSCPAPAPPTTPAPTPAPVPTPPPVTLPTPPPVPSTCVCSELGQQCCATGSPTQYEECVYAADGSIVPIFRPTAPGTKCCPHTFDPKRIILEHIGTTCPVPTTKAPTPAPVVLPTPPPVPSTCVCTELGEQCCNVHSPTQYEECIYDGTLTLTPIFRPTAPGTKCCVHTIDPKRIIQQHVGMPCP